MLRTSAQNWQRFSAVREPCPGCQAAGYEDRQGHACHTLCRQRSDDGGRILQCRKLQPGSEPEGWKCLGEGAQGTTAFFIPIGTSRSKSYHRGPAARRPKPKSDPKAAPDDVLDLAYSQVRALCGEYSVANAPAAREFFASKGATWDATNYSVMPTRAEERELLSRISIDGLGDFKIPGLNLRGRGRWFIRANADPDAAYLEWALGPDGGIRGMRYRFLAPTDTKTKLHGRQRLHHPGGWREVSSRALYLTEGVRKANEAQRLTGSPCLGLPGLHPRNLVGEILEAVKLAKPQRVILAPDFSDLVNGERSDDVRKAIFESWIWLSKRIHAACGADVGWAVWDTDAGKGIDDALVAGAEIETQDLDAYLEQWNWRDDPPMGPF